MVAYEIWTGSNHRTCRICRFRVPAVDCIEDPESEYFATELKVYICDTCVRLRRRLQEDPENEFAQEMKKL